MSSEMRIQSVTGITEYVEAVSTLTDGRWNDLWFRGSNNSSHDLSPTVWRKGYDGNGERNLTNRFRSRAAIRYSGTPGYNALGPWISLMRHYGLPTRLLDWSRSSLIAAYFALEEFVANPRLIPSTDAAVWILDPYKLNHVQGYGNATPSISAHMCRKHLRPAFSHNYTEPGGVLAAMSFETDLRMFAQQGSFTIHSMKEPLNLHDQRALFLSKMIIPKTNAVQLAQEIAVLGLRRGDVYPDLEKLAQELQERS